MTSLKDFCLFVAVIFYVSPIVKSNESSDNSINCQTPNNEPGVCVGVRDCQYIVDIIQKKPMKENTKIKLRSYQCQSQDGFPKVCCPHKNINLINKQGCGHVTYSKFDETIRTKIKEYPWSALISYNTGRGHEFLCGGSVINENYILTSAHCIKDLAQYYTIDGVRLGEHDTTKEVDCNRHDADECVPSVQDIRISEIIPHPNYNSFTLDNNIGLLRLSKPADFMSEAVWPICLPVNLPNRELNRREFYATGWGANYFGKQSNELLLGQYNDVSMEECQSNYSKMAPQIKIGSNQICVREKYAVDYKVCIGERGDLFFDRVNLIYPTVQFGIMSFASKSCENVNQPKVLTKVAPYINWILDNMKP